MKISVILAHPDKSSFNHAIGNAVIDEFESNGHIVIFHDLYEEKFDPILPAIEIPKDAQLPHDIQVHCDEISQADGIVIIHPNWWGQPPAILKGWVDRVIRPGIAYEFIEEDKGEGIPNGLLKAKFALVLNTSNTPTEREIMCLAIPLRVFGKNVFSTFVVSQIFTEECSISLLLAQKKNEKDG